MSGYCEHLLLCLFYQSVQAKSFLLFNPVFGGLEQQSLISCSRYMFLCLSSDSALCLLPSKAQTDGAALVWNIYLKHWEERAWRNTPTFLTLPLRDDTYHFCSRVICHSKSQAIADNTGVGTERLLRREGIIRKHSQYSSFFWQQ